MNARLDLKRSLSQNGINIFHLNSVPRHSGVTSAATITCESESTAA